MFSHWWNVILDLKGTICIFSNVHCSSIFLPRLFEPAASIILRCQTQPFAVTLFHLTLSHFPKPPTPFLLFSQGPGLLPIVPLRTVSSKTGNSIHYFAIIQDLRINIVLLCSKICICCTYCTPQLFYFLRFILRAVSSSDYIASNGGMAGEWRTEKDSEGSGRGL